MATAPTTLLNFSPGALAATYTTASVTPGANTRVFVWGVAYRNGLCTEPTISSSPALNWRKCGIAHTSNSTNPDLFIVGWMSDDVGASPAPMTVTISSASAAGVTAAILTMPASECDGSIIQVATGEDLSAGDPSFTFGFVPDSSALVLGCNWHGGGNAITKPTGYTNLFDNTPSAMTARRAEAFYDNASAAQGPNLTTSTNIRSIVAAVEFYNSSNHMTFNPSDKTTNASLSGGDLKVTSSGSNQWARSTVSTTTKRYCEFTINVLANACIGISGGGPMVFPGDTADSFGLFNNGSGSIAGTFPAWGTTFAVTSVVGMAFDPIAKKVWYRIGTGSWNGIPETGSGGYDVSLYTGTTNYAVACGNNTSAITANFGDQGFAGNIPAGFLPWIVPEAVIPTASFNLTEPFADAATFAAFVPYTVRIAPGFEPFADTASMQIFDIRTVSFSVAENPDSGFFAVTASPAVSFNFTEPFTDTAAFTSTVRIDASFTITEPFHDVATFTTSAVTQTSFSFTEPFVDAAAFTSGIYANVTFGVTEPFHDAATFAASIPSDMAFNIVEPFIDTAAFTTTATTYAAFDIIEPFQDSVWILPWVWTDDDAEDAFWTFVAAEKQTSIVPLEIQYTLTQPERQSANVPFERQRTDVDQTRGRRYPS